MTYVHYLALSGFKGFREWNLFDFSPRVNVVVGGNGTGKSSLVEALLWCLGEDFGRLRVVDRSELLFQPPSQGYSRARSETEQHLLFQRAAGTELRPPLSAGTELRPPLSAGTEPNPPLSAGTDGEPEEAVVHLVLGEESTDSREAAAGEGCCCKPARGQPRDLPPGLVTVTRRLGREGAESLLLDGEPATEEQVARTLRPHGLGYAQVAVVRQGELERVLVADPVLRAEILAQAAGVAFAVPAAGEAEWLALDQELARLRPRLDEVRTRLAEWRRASGSDGGRSDQPIQDHKPGDEGLAVLQARLVRACLAAWGADGRIPGGTARLLHALGLPNDVTHGVAGEPTAFAPASLLAEIAAQRRVLAAEATRWASYGALQREQVELEQRVRALEEARGCKAAERRLSAMGFRRELAEAHRRVQERCRDFFIRLVPGGWVALDLDLPDDDRPPALDIQVAFPEREPERVDRLSGGERALVAFALGLALFLEKPSRLLVLDEVEPALDESNLRRFNDLLGELAASRQVVVVSHQRRTKDLGDVAFGLDHGVEGTSMLHYRYEPATKGLVVFGRVRGNWLERTEALAGEDTGVRGISSPGLERASGALQ